MVPAFIAPAMMIAGKHRIEVPPEPSLRSTQRSQPEIALPSSSSILKSRFCAQRGGGRTRRSSPRQVGAQHDEEADMASAAERAPRRVP